MAGEDGFYLMHRGWQDHPVFRGEAFSRRDAFVWLIEEAAYTERRVAAPKGEVRLARGQLCASLRFMAKAWKWDEAKVRRFIGSLTNAKIIDARTDAGQTVITVCNYDTYQAVRTRPDAPRDAVATQDRRSTDANEKEGKEIKKGEDVVAGASAGAGERLDQDEPAPTAPPPAPRPDPFGPVGELAARFGQAAGVLVAPNRRDFPDQLDTVREWLGLGLDPETEIIPILQRDARGNGPARHSLKYFTPALAKLAARKAAPNEPPRDQDHANPLVRAALRAASARAD